MQKSNKSFVSTSLCVSAQSELFGKVLGAGALACVDMVIARKPGPGQQHAGVEVFNVGRWLTHRDLALEAQVAGC